MSRTYPKAVGYEQVTDSRPWYTKSGRLEFYREEDEFIEAGENLPVHREPIDSTFYEPNVIVAAEARGDAARRARGLRRRRATTSRARCAAGRNVVKTWAETQELAAPAGEGRLPFIFHTPEVPARRAHDADRHRHDRGAVRSVRRPLPARQAQPVRRRGLRRHQSRRREGARRRGRRLRLDRLRSRGPAVPRLAEEREATTSSRGCSAARATTRARRAA